MRKHLRSTNFRLSISVVVIGWISGYDVSVAADLQNEIQLLRFLLRGESCLNCSIVIPAHFLKALEPMSSREKPTAKHISLHCKSVRPSISIALRIRTDAMYFPRVILSTLTKSLRSVSGHAPTKRARVRMFRIVSIFSEMNSFSLPTSVAIPIPRHLKKG